ncbi:DUF1702 family protein [Actinomadura flavalba]|uniref:DUF1702 family protein n=1 Tax=Actinomadura flavalba TaxID=1120938 RepID=UPI0003A930A8|nr:DUF1702 family protein [Actinomadura flavalba]
MPTVIGSMRRLVFAPSLADVKFSVRGFEGASSPAAPALEAIPESVVAGFEWAIEGCAQPELVRRLALVAPELRGFAYEGATMACTILDVMPGRRSDRTRELLNGPGRPHLLLAYIGIGFAMARLPRPLWRKVLPDLDPSPYHPTMSWLAVDGYAFDRAYFDTDRTVKAQKVFAPYPWQGHPDYFPRAADQGVGRALWFLCGARVPAVAAAVRAYAAHRHADLWSGVGLAATFAGGAAPDALAALPDEAGEHAPGLAQGSVFALRARDHAGPLPDGTEAAVAALTGLSVPAALALADASATDRPKDGLPAYEGWRRAVAAGLPAALHR